ncbi:MAG: ABC transporter ATP-binding protein [Deltaproteobacteria bacterium]|nr:ABC transporter ATP-binding protein [Deltaproteobacteria bacterium]MBW2254497.1 ABC transporter ATP-binding protein [Deltaproteobacteria bacterium]
MAAPLLVAEDLTLAFAGVKALDGISLAVPQGLLFAIIGPNGAGKTSFFNCISGLYRPQGGTLQFDDQTLLGMRPHRRALLGIARMFQNLALYEHLSVMENMLIGRHHLYSTRWWQDVLWTRRAQREEVRHRWRVEEIIDFLDLERYRDLPCGILPFGVLKRVELGRALCMDPRLLLLDEPAAGLNQEETEDMGRYILDIREELGVTQILIEHDLHLVLDLADHVAVLDFGRKIAEGTPDEIATHPAVVEAYVGTPFSEGA